MNADIKEQVLNSIDIVNLVSQYIQLKPSGSNFVGLCPFHKDKTPSFFIYPNTHSYYCFGCGAHGNTIDFYMAMENLDFKDALIQLAKTAGISLPEFKPPEHSDKLSKIIEDLHKSIKDYKGDFLQKRGINEESIKTFNIGYCFHIDNPIEELHIDTQRFAQRIIFPVYDENNNPIGLIGRKVWDTEETLKTPKYVYNDKLQKKRLLYPLNITKQFIRKEKEAIVVEGSIDAIILYQNGYKNVVSTLGSVISVEQAELLSRYTKRVILMYDGDKAGKNGMVKSIPSLLQAGIYDIAIVDLPEGEDPASYIDKIDKVEHINYVQFLRDNFEFKDLLPFIRNAISQVSNSIEKEILIEQWSKYLDTTKNILRKMEILIWESPRIMKREDGYYLKNRKISNFIIERVIEVDPDFSRAKLQVRQEDKDFTTILKMPFTPASVYNFMSNAALKGYQCHIESGKQMLYILNGEIASAEIERKEEELPSIEFEKILAYMQEDIKTRVIPLIKETEELDHKQVSCGWQKGNTIYVRLGEFTKRHKLRIKEVVSILKDKGVKQKSMRTPTEEKIPVKVWEIVM